MPFFYNLHIQTQVFSACRWSRKPAWCQCTGTTAWRSTGGPARPRSPTGGTYSPTPPPSTSSLPAQPTSGCPGSPSSVHMPSSEPIIAPSLTMAPQSSDHTAIGGLSNIRPDQIKKKKAEIAEISDDETINMCKRWLHCWEVSDWTKESHASFHFSSSLWAKNMVRGINNYLHHVSDGSTKWEKSQKTKKTKRGQSVHSYWFSGEQRTSSSIYLTQDLLIQKWYSLSVLPSALEFSVGTLTDT